MSVSRYASVEGEALAVVDALERARYFVLGCENLTVAVDHKPLLKIFGDRSLENISNPHLMNLKEKLLRYHFKMIHVPGLKNLAADSMSRHPVGKATKMTLIDDISALDNAIEHSNDHNSIPFLPGSFIANICISNESEKFLTSCENATTIHALNSLQSVTWDDVKVATNSDPGMSKLMTMIKDGIPEFRMNSPWNYAKIIDFVTTSTLTTG